MATTKSKGDVGAGRPVILFHGDKGGVGKSVTCNVFTDWLVKRGVPVAVIDGDSRNPDVGRMFDGAAPVARSNLRVHDGWMDVTDFLLAQKDKVVTMSLPAGIGAELEQEGRRFLSTLAMLQRPLVLVWVMDTGSDVVNLLDQALTLFGDRLAAKIAVRNLYHGQANVFEWEGSEVRKQFEASGGLTINLTPLHSRVRSKVFTNGEAVMPFSLAVVPLGEAESSPYKLTGSENMELIGWLEENHETFDRIRASIGV